MVGVAYAETGTVNDPENDVYCIEGSSPLTGKMTENIGDQPNVDIKKVSCLIEGGKLKLKLEVAGDGQIKTDNAYSYNVEAMTSDGGVYSIILAYGNGGGMGSGPATPSESYGGELLISGNVLEMDWAFQGDATVTDLLASASYSPTSSSIYRDEASVEDNAAGSGSTSGSGSTTGGTGGTGGTGNTGGSGGDSGNKKTPGFEAMALVTAIGVAFTLKKGRK
jgi:hypothetical protein